MERLTRRLGWCRCGGSATSRKTALGSAGNLSQTAFRERSRRDDDHMALRGAICVRNRRKQSGRAYVSAAAHSINANAVSDLGGGVLKAAPGAQDTFKASRMLPSLSRSGPMSV